MERAFINMVDCEDFEFPDGFEFTSLFPEHYDYSMSADSSVIDIHLTGGAARFIIGEAEIACFFEFYEADEEQFEEMHDDEKISVTHGLVGYVAGVIEDVTEREVEWREA